MSFIKKNIKFIFILLLCLAVFYGGSMSSKFLEDTFHPKPVPVLTPKFFPLGQFTVSIPNGNMPHYAMLEVTVESPTPDAEKIINESAPLIKNTIMKLIESKKYAELNREGAIDSLQNEMDKLLNKVLLKNHYKIDFSKVLLTKMILQ